MVDGLTPTVGDISANLFSSSSFLIVCVATYLVSRFVYLCFTGKISVETYKQLLRKDEKTNDTIVLSMFLLLGGFITTGVLYQLGYRDVDFTKPSALFEHYGWLILAIITLVGIIIGAITGVVVKLFISQHEINEVEVPEKPGILNPQSLIKENRKTKK